MQLRELLQIAAFLILTASITGFSEPGRYSELKTPAKPHAGCGKHCSGSVSSRQLQNRQIRLPDGFMVAVEPKIFFNLFDSDTEGTGRVQARFEFRYRPPKNLTGREGRHLMERRTMYSTFKAMFTRVGLDGASCLERAVCETAGTPTHSDGLFGDLVTLVLTPSRELRDLDLAQPERDLADLIEAERWGRAMGSDYCTLAYQKCPVSLFNFADRAADYTGSFLEMLSGYYQPPEA